MNHNPKLPLLAVCVLVVIASCADPAKNKTRATINESSSTETSYASGGSPLAGDVYTLTSDSKVNFTGSKVTGSHDGGFGKVTGRIQSVEGDPEKSSVTVEIDTTSIFSDNERLTNHLKSADFFDVAKYPTATFQSTKIAKSANGYDITGMLILHGVTRSITFPAQIEQSGNEIRAKAEFVLNRMDFDIKYAGKADDLIRNDVVIRLDIKGVKG